MIKWREGKAGFVGAAKRLIKGFFDSSFTLTSESVAPDPEINYPSSPQRTVSFKRGNRSVNFAGQNRSATLTKKNRSIT